MQATSAQDTVQATKADKTITPKIDSSSVSAAFDSKKVIASQIAKASSAPAKALKIEASSLAQNMRCRENKEGNIQCELENEYLPGQKIEFNIEDILARQDSYGNLDPDYWNNQWNEKYVYQFPENLPENKNIMDDFSPFADVIRMALNDYDELVYANKLKNQGEEGLCTIIGENADTCLESVNNISLIKPEFKKIKSDAFMSQDYDKFNL